jgi:hypothetical protein
VGRVGDVVHGAAEAIDREQGAAAFAFQHRHAAREGGSRARHARPHHRGIGGQRARQRREGRSDIQLRQRDTPLHRIGGAQPGQKPPSQVERDRRLPAQAGSQQPRQRRRDLQHRFHPVERGSQHGAALRIVGGEEGVLPTRQLHPGQGQVHAVHRSAVGHQILQVVQDLQTRAERIGGRIGRRILPMHPQQHAPDRVGGAGAVIFEFGPIRVAALGRVLAEGAEHGARFRRADIPQRAIGRIQQRLQRVQAPQLL